MDDLEYASYILKTFYDDGKFIASGVDHYIKFLDGLPTNIITYHVAALTLSPCDANIYTKIIKNLIKEYLNSKDA